MIRLIARARFALRRSMARLDRAADRDMPASSTHTTLRHHWIDPLSDR
jgi:hypothetical protein